MNKAVFLDRDGVINDGTLYYTYKIEDFKFNADVFESLQLLVKAGFLLVVVSNQGGVARGIYSDADVNKVHEYMRQELLKHNIPLAGIYYCPHHSDVSKCDCRKPKPGMILQAIKDLEIDPRRSFMIGDGKRDIKAAQKANIKGILIQKNAPLMPHALWIIKSYSIIADKVGAFFYWAYCKARGRKVNLKEELRNSRFVAKYIDIAFWTALVLFLIGGILGLSGVFSLSSAFSKIIVGILMIPTGIIFLEDVLNTWMKEEERGNLFDNLRGVLVGGGAIALGIALIVQFFKQ